MNRTTTRLTVTTNPNTMSLHILIGIPHLRWGSKDGSFFVIIIDLYPTACTP